MSLANVNNDSEGVKATELCEASFHGLACYDSMHSKQNTYVCIVKYVSVVITAPAWLSLTGHSRHLAKSTV